MATDKYRNSWYELSQDISQIEYVLNWMSRHQATLTHNDGAITITIDGDSIELGEHWMGTMSFMEGYDFAKGSTPEEEKE